MVHRRQKDERQKWQIQAKSQIYSYRNAIYQGELSPITGKRTGGGIIYVTGSHHFIATNEFAENKLNGNSLFYHQNGKYMYGEWRNNKPSGIIVTRIGEILIIAQFIAGKLLQSKKFIAVFQKQNLGLILQTKNSGKLQIFHKEDVLGSTDILRLIDSCQFTVNKNQKEATHHSLIKYLNKSISFARRDSPRLRLINNSYYRYGYEVGLAILFDDQFRLLSVGLHNKNILNSFGVKYHGISLAHRVEEGVFNGFNTFTFDLKSKPQDKLSQLYRKTHLSEINFVNQIYKDPSQEYFKLFKDLLNQQIIVSLFESQKLNSSLTSFGELKSHSEQQQLIKNQKPLQKLKLDSFSLKNLMKNPVPADSISLDFTNLRNNQFLQNSRQSNQLYFESLSEKERLLILKKQLYQNLNQKVKLPQTFLGKQNLVERQRIITKSPVKIKLAAQKKIPQTLYEQLNYRIQDQNLEKDVINLKQLSQQKELFIPNLQRKIDIIIKNEPNSSSYRKSKRRIFQEYSTVKRDYSPQIEISPFKAKMKSIIFQQTPLRQQRSRSKSSHRIFGASKTPEKYKTSKYSASKPQRIINAEYQKDETQIKLKNLAVAIQRKGQRQLEKQNEQWNRPKMKDYQKTKIQNYLNKRQEKNTNAGQIIKKSNGVYKNNMIYDQKRNYVQTINTNAPYLQNKGMISKTLSNTTLKNSPSKTILQPTTSKKSVQDLSPNKKYVINAYKFGHTNQLKEAQRLSDFKRTVNYF